jgi:hypothetical protein
MSYSESILYVSIIVGEECDTKERVKDCVYLVNRHFGKREEK